MTIEEYDKVFKNGVSVGIKAGYKKGLLHGIYIWLIFLGLILLVFK